MISNDEFRAFVDRFGVPDSQIARDHLVSHLLLALPRLSPGTFVFFGGTALCRTHLLDWRLSEDIDLLVDDVGPWRDALGKELPRQVRRHYPNLELRWEREGLTTVGRATVSNLTVRIQLVQLDYSYRRYATEHLPVHLRYSDVPPTVTLDVPTVVAAVAMKLNAWVDRQAPRDLADLYALADRGLVTTDAVDLANEVGHAVVPHAFDEARIPDGDTWHTALGSQMRDVPPVRQVLDAVRAAVSASAGW